MDNEILDGLRQLSAKEILETYYDIEEHIKYLNESIIEITEEGGENNG